MRIIKNFVSRQLSYIDKALKSLLGIHQFVGRSIHRSVFNSLLSGLIIWGLFGLTTSDAEAMPLVCHQYQGHEVCIERIKRSGRNYWEYLVKLRIDQQIQPFERYDCRHRQRIDREGFIEPFKVDDVGEFICGYFTNRKWR